MFLPKPKRTTVAVVGGLAAAHSGWRAFRRRLKGARTLSDWILDIVFGREIAAISIDDRTRVEKDARVLVADRI